MEENQVPATPPADAQSPPAGKLTIEPTGNIEPAKINVGNFEQAVPMVTASPPASSPSSTADATAEPAWKPTSGPAFSSPRSTLFFSLLGLFATLMLFTFGVSVNSWIKPALILAFAVGGMFFAMRAYRTDHDVNVLVALMISTTLFTGTVIIGGAYTYYYIKIHQAIGSLKNYNY